MEKSVTERRKHERIDLVFFISIFDRITGQLVGYLADITPDGALILTEEKISLDTELNLNIETVSEEFKKEYFEVDAVCVRSGEKNDLDFYESGLKFTKIKQGDLDKIKEIVSILKFE